MSLRASQTQGFVTPGLFSLFGEPNTSTARQNVTDYVCDSLPDLPDCLGTVAGQGVNGSVQNVIVGASPNSALGAETSDLWNAGISFRLLEGDLNVDVDYTSVVFKGRIDRLGASVNVASNSIGFFDYVTSQCAAQGPVSGPNGRTLVDPDNVSRWGQGTPQFQYTNLTADEFAALLPQAEKQCRANAALSWVNSAARDGHGETPYGGTRLERGRGPNGLGLTLVEDPWLEQGRQATETLIYSLRYGFDAAQIPMVGGDYGRFTASLSATQMLTQEITRFKSIGCDKPNAQGVCPGDSPFAGITGSGLGNNNGVIFVPGPDFFGSTIAPMAPTPEWRVNLGLRWSMGDHTAQLMGRWHAGISNILTTWDAFRDRGLLTAAQAAIPQADVCSQQPFKICDFPAEWYWDVSYSYERPDVFNTNMNLHLNASIRNVFNTYPQPSVGFSSHNAYIDNIMGRIGFFRVSLKM
jgi:outer membrane receptor protein involved in Fe transport